MNNINHFTAGALIAAIFVLGACQNTNYGDLMRVTGEANVSIADHEKTYTSGATSGERAKARNEIVRLRQKQMIMAQRINVKTMPEVKGGTMTLAEGEAKKSELVAAATKRYEEAQAMTIPRH
jgi:hypothetical protein